MDQHVPAEADVECRRNPRPIGQSHARYRRQCRYREGDRKGKSHVRVDLIPRLIIHCGTQALLNHNAKVWIAGRNPKRVAEAVEDLRKETGKVALVLHMDLADLQSIKRAVAEFLRYAAATRLGCSPSDKDNSLA